MKITKVHFIFENCEGADVDPKHIDRVFISGIREDLYIQKNDVFENTYCDHLKIVLVDYAGIEFEGCVEKHNLMQRLFLRDVTGICLYYDNDTDRTFHPPWGEKDYESEYQQVEEKSWRTGEKYLEITFDKSKKA